MFSSLKKFFLIIVLLCQPSFAFQDCNFNSLNKEKAGGLQTKVIEKIEQNIRLFLEKRKIPNVDDIYIPVGILNMWHHINNSNYLGLQSYISAAFNFNTEKDQYFCNTAYENNSECYYDQLFPLSFKINIIRDEQGIPLKKYCRLVAPMTFRVVNVTQTYFFEKLEIFGEDETIHEWEIPISDKDLY